MKKRENAIINSGSSVKIAENPKKKDEEELQISTNFQKFKINF